MVVTRGRSALATVQEVQAASNRMSLAAVVGGMIESPPRICIVGVEGVGKTTFGAEAPNPVFVSTESGTGRVKTNRFPEPESYPDVLAAIEVLTTQNHAYKTLVIDSVDWLEPLIWQDVCRRNGVTSIEDVGGGYGKGYIAAQEEFRGLLAHLERLQKAKGMGVILLMHAIIKPFSNPSGPDFSRYVGAIQDKAYGVIKQFVDVLGFATFEETVSEKKGKAKGVSTGRRVLHLERSAAWDAKTRFDLPPVIPFSYADFAEAMAAGREAAPEDLTADCLALADELGLPADHAARTSILKRAGNTPELLRILNKLRMMKEEN